MFNEKVLAMQQVGFSAQEVQKVFPEAVGSDDYGYLNFNIHPILIAEVNAFKEQQTQITTLQMQNEALKKQYEEMKDDLSAVKALLPELQSAKSKTASH